MKKTCNSKSPELQAAPGIRIFQKAETGLLSLAGSQLFRHLCQGLLVNVVDQSNADKLANCAEGVQACNQPAHSAGSLSRLTDGTQSLFITNQGSASDFAVRQP